MGRGKKRQIQHVIKEKWSKKSDFAMPKCVVVKKSDSACLECVMVKMSNSA
jgi:hypothetical protein